MRRQRFFGGCGGETTSIVSKGEREAEEVVEKATQHAEVLVRLGSQWAGLKKKRSDEMRLASKGRIISLPATSAGRGYSGNIILDEFAYHTDPKKIYDGASGSVLHGGKTRIVSTPNGVGNLFHDIWTNQKLKGWSKHAVTLDQAISQGLKVNIEDCWELALHDKRLFGQLFHCNFLDGALQYIPNELIERALAPGCAVYGEHYAGLDIGRVNDLTSLVVVCNDAQGVRWVVHEETRKRTEPEDIEYLVHQAVWRWGCRRVGIDASGLGTFPAIQMQKKYGLYRVIPVTISPKIKGELATTMYQHFADGRIRLPEDNLPLREDVASIRRIITAAGNVTYDAPRTEKGHADRAWALALALQGCSAPSRQRFEQHDYDPDAA
jgi:phage FluMu gp28-like protein